MGIEDFWLKILLSMAPSMSSVLDIGFRNLCAAKRIAAHFGDGHYGVDVQPTDLGPNYRQVEPDDFGAIFGRRFDCVYASCVVYHLTDALAERLFTVLPTLTTRFLANINTVSTPDKWKGFPFVKRSVSFYQDMAARHGGQVTDRGPLSDYGYNQRPETAKNRLIEVNYVL